MFSLISPLIIFGFIFQSLPLNCAQESVTDNEQYDLFGCPDSPPITYLFTNTSITKYFDYRSNCIRQLVLQRPDYNYSDENIDVVKEAILVITHLDLDLSTGDYILVSNGLPSETYRPKFVVLTSNIDGESKTIAIYSPITWIGLVTLAKGKSAISLSFTWIAPELSEKVETLPAELRLSSIDLCFEDIDCPVVWKNQELIKSGLNEMINEFVIEQNITDINPINDEQVKIIRNESRIADEQYSDNKYCRVQLSVTSQIDINWAHPKLTKEVLSKIWLLTNTSDQTIDIPGDHLSYRACQEETFDPFITLQSAGIFIAGLGASIGLWRWHNAHILSNEKAIKPKINPITQNGMENNTKQNPIYESEEDKDDEYVLGERNQY